MLLQSEGNVKTKIIREDLLGNPKSLIVNTNIDRVIAYLEGDKLIQHALPELTRDEREFILTGILPGEFDALFNPEKLEEEDDSGI